VLLQLSVQDWLDGTLRRVLQRTSHFRPVSLPDQNVFNSIKDKGNTLAYIPQGKLNIRRRKY